MKKYILFVVVVLILALAGASYLVFKSNNIDKKSNINLDFFNKEDTAKTKNNSIECWWLDLEIPEYSYKIGEIFTAKLTITNSSACPADLSDAPLKNLNITLKTSSNLQPLDNINRSIETIKDGESQSVSWRIKTIGDSIDKMKSSEFIEVIAVAENAGEEKRKKNINIILTKPSDCEIFNNFDKKFSCYEEIIEEPSQENCNQIVDEKIKEKCLYNIDKKLLCSKLSEISQKDTCYSSLAREEKDYNLCFSISEDAKDNNGNNLKWMCVRDLAVMTDNSIVCSKIKDSYYSDWCYLDLATILRDNNLCEKIESQNTKNTCYSEVKNNL